MRTGTSEKILELVREKGQMPARDIIDFLGISKQAVFRHLAKLLEQRRIYKIGRVPKVFYVISEKPKEEKEYIVPANVNDFINQRFLDITPAGEVKEGWPAFVGWCLRRGQNVQKAAVDYVAVVRKYDAVRQNGLLDGMKKLKSTFPGVFLDKLFYLDFYALEHFGKTKLGQKLLYAKQSQDKRMIKELTEEVKPKIEQLIKQYNIEAVGFIAPTVKREIQFMKELEKNLALGLKKIKITKVKTPVIVPQKTLNKLADRVENAKRTFVVESQPSCKNVLLIDDAVGSGATFNEIARQIKAKGIVKNKIVGLAITGSLKGFEVISEV